MKQKVTAALGQYGPATAFPSTLLVGTDCSGIEAPIHALHGLGISHEHCWSSEVAKGPREVLLANTPPTGHVFEDVLDAKVQMPGYVHLYVSGFSCKPFSTLHNGSKLLGEPQAKIFWAVVSRIMAVRPACFVLENVQGIRRVQAQVVKALQGKGLYHVATLKMDPGDLGEPLQRPRVYFFGVRADVATVSPTQLQEILASSWSSVRSSCMVQGPRSAGPRSTVPLQSRMLPDSHSAVVDFQLARRERWLKAWLWEVQYNLDLSSKVKPKIASKLVANACLILFMFQGQRSLAPALENTKGLHFSRPQEYTPGLRKPRVY